MQFKFNTKVSLFPLNTGRYKSFYRIDDWNCDVIRGQTISKCMTRVETTPCSANQLGTKYPSVPTVTSWYLHALWIYLGGEGGRQGRARNQGLRPRSRDKLAKPLRWFQLKLEELPVGSINFELAQTLTSMGGTFSPWPRYLGAPSVWLWLSLLPPCILILCSPSTFYYRELQLGLSATLQDQNSHVLCVTFYSLPHIY